MEQSGFVIRGDICTSRSPQEIAVYPDSYLVSTEGKCRGVFTEIPKQYHSLLVRNYEGCLIIPGLSDLHVHAPQFSYRALGMDRELLAWLNRYTFPEEAKFSSSSYADEAYGYFVDALRRSATTRACIFGTVHRKTVEMLMDKLDQTGLFALVGKVNMDREVREDLLEKNSAEETETWLKRTMGKYKTVKPILTPRFVPTCSDGLLEKLGELQRAYQVPVQSHLSENPDEIELVHRLCPWSDFYGDVYDHFGLFGGEVKTVMAHCVYSTDAEVERIKERGVFVAHCPQSNTNIASGIAPIRKYLRKGIYVGLGSDVAGGAHLSIFRAMTDAIQVSKLYWRLLDPEAAPLSAAEAFYLGTAGGGAFFGKVGRFEEGYDFDAVILSDQRLPHPHQLSIEERLERLIYLSDDRDIRAKYVCGREIEL